MADDVGRLSSRLELDVVDFKAGITTANREMRVLKSEFNATQASLGPLASGMEGLTAKSENLSKRIEIQRDKLSKLSAMYDQAKKAAKEKGDTTVTTQKALDGLAIKVNNAKAALGKMENELTQTKDEMKKLSDESVLLEQKLTAVGNKFKSLGDSASKIGSKMTTHLTLPIIAAGAAAVKFASDVEESLSKTDIVFGGASGSVKSWAETTITSLGLAQATALEMASGYGDLATSMEITQSKASQMGMELSGRAADLASFKNIQIEVAETALAAIFTGETESLKKLGVVMTQANLEAYALSMGIEKNIADMTEAEKVNLRYAYVMDKTSNAAGDYARTADGAANQSRTLKENLKEAATSIGNQLLPVFTNLVTKANEVVTKFVNMDDGSKKMIITIAGIIAAVGPALVMFGKLSSGVGAVINIIPKLKTAVAGVQVALAAMAANPVVLAIGAVSIAVAAIGIAAYKSSQETKQLKEDIIQMAKETADANIDAINESYLVQQETLDAELASERSASEEAIALIDEEYEAKKESYQNGVEDQRKALQQQLQDAQKAHNESINAIRKEYGVFEQTVKSKTELAREEADTLIEEAQRVHDEKIALLDEELENKQDSLDRATDLTIGNLEDQIALLEGATEEEIALEKQKRLEAEIIELEDLIATEKNAEEKVRLIEEREALIQEAVQISADQQITIQKYKIREEILAEKIKAEELKVEYQTAYEEQVTELEEKLAEEIELINSKAEEEILKIQEERIAKEEAENAKFEATSGSLQSQLDSLSSYQQEYFAQLDAELAEKKRIEEEKLAAVEERIAAERLALEEAQMAEIEVERARENAVQQYLNGTENIVKISDIDLGLVPVEYRGLAEDLISNNQNNPDATVDLNKVITGELWAYDFSGNRVLDTLIDQYYDETQGDGQIPEKAVGDNFWTGGYVRVHEKGGEIINLARGSQIIPHDVSMAMARSYGDALAKSGHQITMENNFYSPKALERSEILDIVADQQRAFYLQLQGL